MYPQNLHSEEVQKRNQNINNISSYVIIPRWFSLHILLRSLECILTEMEKNCAAKRTRHEIHPLA
jgi:hypothetical protein